MSELYFPHRRFIDTEYGVSNCFQMQRKRKLNAQDSVSIKRLCVEVKSSPAKSRVSMLLRKLWQNVQDNATKLEDLVMSFDPDSSSDEELIKQGGRVLFGLDVSNCHIKYKR